MLARFSAGDGESEDAGKEERVPKRSDSRCADRRYRRNKNKPVDVRALQEERRSVQPAADAQCRRAHDDVLRV